jgi:hypothetical protein
LIFEKNCALKTVSTIFARPPPPLKVDPWPCMPTDHRVNLFPEHSTLAPV